MLIYDINISDGTVMNPAGRDAPIDPMRGEPRVPACATALKPPVAGEQEAARWNGEAWEIVADYRGNIYFTADGEKHEIKELGTEPPTDNVSTRPRPGKHYGLKSGEWIENKQAALEDWRETASVTSRQGMEQLIRVGLDDEVDEKIEAITDPLERKLTRNWVDKAQTWERNNAQFISLGEALGLTLEQMDEHIKAAAKL